MIFQKRLPEDEEKYKKHLAELPPGYCYPCEAEVLETYKYWKLVALTYPYNAIASEHYLLALIRHAAGWKNVTSAELLEFQDLLDSGRWRVDQAIFNFPHMQSQPDHLHLHLIKYK